MSNRISDADIDAILREFSEQQEQETRAAESAPSRRRESAAPAAPVNPAAPYASAAAGLTVFVSECAPGPSPTYGSRVQ